MRRWMTRLLTFMKRLEANIMEVKPIAYSYWRRIKDGARTYDSVPASVKEDVRTLARADVANGVITPEQYKEFIGEPYEEK